MMVEIETEAQREGTGVQSEQPGSQDGTVPALPTVGPWPCAKPLSVRNSSFSFVLTIWK